MKKYILTIVAGFMVAGAIAFVSCNKDVAESMNETSLKSESKRVDKLVFGIYIQSTRTLNYGLDIDNLAYAVEKYAEEKLDKEIVFEQSEIIDFETNEPMFHISYFDVTRDISINQWIDLMTKTVGDTIVYYTAEPNPGLCNVNVFTCTGTCNTECKVRKDPQTKEKYCNPCPDADPNHKCEGKTSSVDVISYVFDQIAKLSPFTNLFGNKN